MTAFGDIYYEGKENDIRSKNFKPGKLSDNLRVLIKIYLIIIGSIGNNGISTPALAHKHATIWCTSVLSKPENSRNKPTNLGRNPPLLQKRRGKN